MWAIRNKRTRKWMYGTKWTNNYDARQLTSNDQVMVFDTYEQARLEMRWRQCGRDYEIVPVRIEEVR